MRASVCLCVCTRVDVYVCVHVRLGTRPYLYCATSMLCIEKRNHASFNSMFFTLKTIYTTLEEHAKLRTSECYTNRQR